MALEILSTTIDKLTGHITAQIRVVETATDGTTTHGPVETVGISQDALTKRYGCPHETDPCPVKTRAAMTAWLKDRHEKSLDRKRTLATRAQVAGSLQGQVLDFDDEVSS